MEYKSTISDEGLKDFLNDDSMMPAIIDTNTFICNKYKYNKNKKEDLIEYLVQLQNVLDERQKDEFLLNLRYVSRNFIPLLKTLFDEKNVYLTTSISEELKGYTEKIDHYIKNFCRIREDKKDNNRKVEKRQRIRKGKSMSIKMDSLVNKNDVIPSAIILLKNYKKILNELRNSFENEKRVFVEENPAYCLFYEVLHEYANNMRQEIKGCENWSERKKNNYTDERTIASAICASAERKSLVRIITGDNDYREILEGTSWKIFHKLEESVFSSTNIEICFYHTNKLDNILKTKKTEMTWSRVGGGRLITKTDNKIIS